MELACLSRYLSCGIDEISNELWRGIGAQRKRGRHTGIVIGGDDICAGTQEIEVGFANSFFLISVSQSNIEETFHRPDCTADRHTFASKEMSHASVKNMPGVGWL